MKIATLHPYRGIVADVCRDEDGSYYGSVDHDGDIIHFESRDWCGVEGAFQDSVDEYFKMLEEDGYL